MSELSKQLGPAFIQKIGLEYELPRLVSYLSDEQPNQVSHRKLQLALSLSDSDPHL